MGMAASQARYLALVARKSNCEYEGQQINQARMALSNQSANLFNQMLTLSVPVPPSTQDFTKIQYSFTDGFNGSTITRWEQLADNPDYNYLVTSHYYADKYTGSLKKLSDPQVQLKQDSAIPTTQTNLVGALNSMNLTQATLDAATKAKNADENGFVCYELWLKTNTSAYSEFKVKFSLGSEKSTCSGYAIIAGISLEKLSSETLFNEYCDANEELYKENDANSVAKRFYGTEEAKKDETKDDEDDNDSSIWATFFYIFSSLLLGIVLVIALVAIFIKKHPIKSSKHKVEEDIIDMGSDGGNNADSDGGNKGIGHVVNGFAHVVDAVQIGSDLGMLLSSGKTQGIGSHDLTFQQIDQGRGEAAGFQ